MTEFGFLKAVIFPAVPHHGGLLRVQVNANHPPAEIDALVGALADVRGQPHSLPRA